MIQFINHYSYAIAAALALFVIGQWALQRRTARSLGALVLAAVLLVGVDLAFRPGDPSVAAAAEFDRLLADGRPTLVEFYSNY